MNQTLKHYIGSWKARPAAFIQSILIFFVVLIQPFKELHSFYDGLLAISLIFTIVMIIKGKFHQLPRAFIYIFGAYTLSILISTFMSIDVEKSLDEGLRSEYLKQVIVFALLLVNAETVERRIKTVIAAFFLSGLIMSTIGFFPYFWGSLRTYDNRLLSFSGSYTRLAYFYTLYIPFLVLLVPRNIKWKSALYALLFLSIVATLFTKTRGAWVSIPPALLTVCLISRKYKRLAFIFAMTVMSVGVILVASPDLRNRIADFEELKKGSGSFGQRFGLWKSAVQTISENPVYGIGYGKYMFRKAYSLNPVKGSEAHSDTHNTYLEIMLQRGVIGFLTTAALYLFFLSRAWKANQTGNSSRRDFFAYFMAISAAFALFSLVDNIYVKETGRYLWQIGALAFLFSSDSDEE